MKCRYCKKNFEQIEQYCPNCGRELNLENKKKIWPYFLVLSITIIEIILIFMPIKHIINFFSNYEIEDIRETKFIEEVKKLGCNVVDITESNNNSNVLAFYITDSNTCPYLISYTKFKDSNLQNNFYNQLVKEAENINGYKSYSSVNFNNYKEYNSTNQNEYRVALYGGKITIYMQGDVTSKALLTNLKKELGFDLKMDWSFLSYIVAYIIIVNVMIIISWWLINRKMGRQGWICLIPIYNIICLCEDVLGKKSYAWLFLIPYVNFVFIVILLVHIAKVFGKDDGYQILTVFFSSITIPLIAFDDSTYTRPNKDSNLMSNNTSNTNYIITDDNHIETKPNPISETKELKKDNVLLITFKWMLTFGALFMTLGSYLLVVEDKEYEYIIPGIIFLILAIMACPLVTEHTKKFKTYSKYKNLIVFIIIVILLFIFSVL